MSRETEKRRVELHKENLGRGALAHLLRELTGQFVTDWHKENVEIQYTGKKITLPDDPEKMPIRSAIHSLERLEADEEQVSSVTEDIMAHPLEAAVAFHQAMVELYNWASPVDTPVGFWAEPPELISVQVGVNEWIQVPWGSFMIPGVENRIKIDVDRTSRGVAFLRIHGHVRKREKTVLLQLAAKTREILLTRSIYRGQALHILCDESGALDYNNPPSFIDLSKVDENELILSKSVMDQVETNIFDIIKNTDRARELKIPLKRGTLLEGSYGVGKTLISRIIAKLCIQNDWTFINIDRASSLTEAFKFAERYPPAYIFIEDIDQFMTDRTNVDQNDLLNTVGGLLSEGKEISYAMTTNHISEIDPAMLRQGRIDAVISVTPPDAEAVGRLIRLYSRGFLKKEENLDRISEVLAGSIPAAIREVAERSKIRLIRSNDNFITEDDLLITAEGIQNHLRLIKPRAKELSTNEKFGEAFRALITEEVYGEDDKEDKSNIDLSKALRELWSVLRSVDKTTHLQTEIIGASVVSSDKKLTNIDKKVTDIHKSVT